MIRGDLLRVAGLPLLTRLPGLSDLPRGQQLELEVLGSDLVDLTLQARVHRVLAAALADVDVEPEAEATETPKTPELRADEPPADGTRESS